MPSVLVLGSLPGVASLAAGEYYAQSQNAFWRIMGEICEAHPELAYDDQLAALRRSGVALWDVLLEAERPGSLDSSIVASSQRVNDVAGLLTRHPSIALVAFNGKKAADVFARVVEPALGRNDFVRATLPSTSPAYASLKREQKLARWRQALVPYLRAV